jgi:hypothetical protein
MVVSIPMSSLPKLQSACNIAQWRPIFITIEQSLIDKQNFIEIQPNKRTINTVVNARKRKEPLLWNPWEKVAKSTE